MLRGGVGKYASGMTKALPCWAVAVTHSISTEWRMSLCGRRYYGGLKSRRMIDVGG